MYVCICVVLCRGCVCVVCEMCVCVAYRLKFSWDETFAN